MKIKRVIAPNTTREDVREFARKWQYWVEGQDLSYGELAEWSAFFEEIGKKFDLTDEFKENGII